MTSEERIQLTAEITTAVLHALSGPLQQVINLSFVMRAQDPAAPLTALDRGLARLADTVQRLRRVDIVRRPTRRVPVRCEDVVARLHGALGDQPRVHFTTRSATEVMLVDPEVWCDACLELIDNALRAGSDDVHVVVSAEGSPSVTVTGGASTWPTPPSSAVDPTYSTKGEVVGFGLAIAHTVARAHGGRLKIDPDRREVSITADEEAES